MSGLSFELRLSRPVQILLGVFLLAVLGLAVAGPVMKMRRGMDENVRSARARYLDALAMTTRYKALEKTQSSKNSVMLTERLFPYVERVTSELKLAKRIDYIRPENRMGDDGTPTEAVHVAFKGITIDEFVKFLYRIEVQKKEIFIKAISIKKDGRRNLNTQMTLQKIG
jgi:hypothetical protein